MEKKLLLLSKNKDDLLFAQGAAKFNNLELTHCADISSAVEEISQANDELAAVFVEVNSSAEYQAFEKAMEEKVGLFSDKVNSNHIHYISPKDIEDVGFLFKSPIFGNYIFRNYKDPGLAGERYGYVLAATLRHRAFGLKSLLRPERSKVQTINFKNTKEKQDGVEAVKNYLIQAKFKTRMATVIANAVDELVMNAMFDAPIDALGKPIYLTTPRSTAMPISSDHPVEMNVGFDGEYAIISAVDHYGSLDRNKLFEHLAKTYKKEDYKIKTASAGAGIGLANVFRSGGSFLFVSDKGAKTEVLVFFKRTENFIDFKDQFRFIASQFYF